MSEFLQLKQKIVTAVDEFDYKERLKPSAILQYFQDIATLHALHLGIGYEDMLAKNLCWILSRVSVVIDAYPDFGEEITLYTFPRKPNLVDAIRDYYIYNKNNELLIRGTSKWCVLDVKNRAIRRCAPLFSFQDSQYRPDAPFADGNPQLSGIAPPCVPADEAAEFVVRITDLDRNGHMNNARYGDVLLNCFSKEFLDTHTMKSFHINFLSELLAGSRYSVLHCDSGKQSLIEAKQGERPIFRAQIEWQA